MKQLLIVNSGKALNATGATPYDLSKLDEGAITFWELGASTPLAAAPKKNFGIALGRGNNSPAFVIPEVDVNTLSVAVAEPVAGKAFEATIVCPAPEVGDVYTVVIVKKNTVFHERNTWTSTVTATTKVAADVAKALTTDINNKSSFGGVNIEASVSGATITIKGTVIGEDWEIKTADALFSTEPTITYAEKNIGDTAFIQDLARKCAGGKGINYLGDDGAEIYPGYPESVESIAQADIATKGYVLFSLHFATGRAYGKQLDERIWQDVYIAVPKNSPALGTITTILGQPVLVNND